MKKQLLSFYCAVRGVLRVFESEAHMRFHLVAALYVMAFAIRFYKLSSLSLCVLVLTISAVFVAEIINTAVEKLCDKVTKEYSETIKLVKDACAGAVLISALASVIVAVVLFIKPVRIIGIILHFIRNPLSLVLLILSAVLAVLFVLIKPSKYINAVKKLFSSNKNIKDDTKDEPISSSDLKDSQSLADESSSSDT